MLTIFAACAELEREQILERQAEGIALAKAAGKYHGRVRGKYDAAALKAVCGEWREGRITAQEAMRRLGLKRNTFYRRVKELGL